MTIFYITIISTTLLALLARLLKTREEKPNIIITIFIAITFSIVAGLRTNIGDTSMYIHSYNITSFDKILGTGYEPGFLLFFNILKSINNDGQFMLIVTASITNIVNIMTIRKYSKNNLFELAIFLYTATGYYIVTMNGIRQCLVASLLFLATDLIIRQKFKKYFLVVIFCMTIHQSAFIMLPIYFIAQTKVWSKSTKYIVASTIVIMIFYQPVFNILTQIIGNGKYTGYAELNEGGANIIRVIISAVPVILAYIKRKELKDKWPESNIFVNIALINLMIMVFATVNWIFARFTLYLNLYEFILIPFIIKNCFVGKERRLLYYSLLICYCFYFYYDNAITMNIIYETNFSIAKFLF